MKIKTGQYKTKGGYEIIIKICNSVIGCRFYAKVIYDSNRICMYYNEKGKAIFFKYMHSLKQYHRYSHADNLKHPNLFKHLDIVNPNDITYNKALKIMESLQ